MMKKNKTVKKSTGKNPPSEGEINNNGMPPSGENVNAIEIDFLTLAYWETDISFLEYIQRGKTRHNDNYVIVSFQLIFNDKKVGAPVRLYEYLTLDLENDIDKKELDKFIEKVIIEKIEFMNLSSGIELKFITNYKKPLMFYKVTIENNNIKIEKSESKSKNNLKNFEKTLTKIVETAISSIPLLVSAVAVGYLGGKRK